MKLKTKQIFIFLLIPALICDIFLKYSWITIPFISSTACSFLALRWAIPKLKDLNCKQIVREEGPKNHKSKSGTATMGGIIVIPIAIVTGILYTMNSIINDQLILISFNIFIFMIIGAIDDWKSLARRSNEGLTPIAKIILQFISSILFIYVAKSNGWIISKIYLFQSSFINFGILISAVALFVLLAESNATNLTDGLDGLASGCGALVFMGIAIDLVLRQDIESVTMSSFCATFAGAWVGFLYHNKNPAKIFMGDAGSLGMGAALASISLISNSLWALLIMGGIFLVESVSVIIQVSVFKLTKRFNGKGVKVLKMSPLHHHYELIGNNENTIVQSFWLVTLGLVLIGLLLRSTP